jgi:hypothetical protein
MVQPAESLYLSSQGSSTTKSWYCLPQPSAPFSRRCTMLHTTTPTRLLIVLTLSATLLSCSSKPTFSVNKDRSTPPEGPSRDDLINAVRRSVESKTIVQQVPQQRTKTNICSQYDVEADPNAKHNPELARCPRAGATYTTIETDYVSQNVKCPGLPASSTGWDVSKVGPDSWRVSNGGSSWTVSKTEGRTDDAGSVHLSSFTFKVNAHQPC